MRFLLGMPPHIYPLSPLVIPRRAVIGFMVGSNGDKASAPILDTGATNNLSSFLLGVEVLLRLVCFDFILHDGHLSHDRVLPDLEADSRPAWNSLLAPADMIGDDTASSDMILWDVRQKKATDVDGTKLPKSALNLNAIQPNVNKLVLISPDLPWKIVVSNPKGITVNDVLTAVYDTLNAQITEPEYWLASEEAQKRMNRAYLDATNGKTGVPGREPTEGVKRVDFLGDSVLFGGIRPLDERDDVFVKKRNASTPRKVEELWIIEFGEPED